MLVEANTDSMYSKRRPLPELEMLELTINVMTNGHPLSILELRRAGLSLDDQTQVDSKPAGQPEHASLNQCQLIAVNRPKMVLWAPPAGGGDKVSL